MFRALLELLFSIFVIIVARSILSAVMKGVASSAAGAFQQHAGQQHNTAQQAANNPPPHKAGTDLHKDPVCGTYVAETTPFRRSSGGETFYYCSGDCRNKHSVVAR